MLPRLNINLYIYSRCLLCLLLIVQHLLKTQGNTTLTNLGVHNSIILHVHEQYLSRKIQVFRRSRHGKEWNRLHRVIQLYIKRISEYIVVSNEVIKWVYLGLLRKSVYVRTQYHLRFPKNGMVLRTYRNTQTMDCKKVFSMWNHIKRTPVCTTTSYEYVSFLPCLG